MTYAKRSRECKCILNISRIQKLLTICINLSRLLSRRLESIPLSYVYKLFIALNLNRIFIQRMEENTKHRIIIKF